MTKLSILAILSLAFIGVTRIAQFVMALFVIVFFGFTTFELIRTFRQPAQTGSTPRSTRPGGTHHEADLWIPAVCCHRCQSQAGST
jgi:hypothetical protein